MLNLNNINDNSIIICPMQTKNEIINKLSNFPLKNIKFISKKELIEGVYFSYDNEALYYLRKKGYSYQNAKEILDNLIFIKSGTNNLNLLKEIHDELFSKYLLKYNPLYKHLFLNKKVYIYGYSLYDNEIKNALNKINVKYEIIEEKYEEYKKEYYAFSTQKEELKYIFYKIGELLESGVNLNKICFYKYPSEYALIIKKYMENYNIPFESNDSQVLYEAPIFKEFLLHAKELSIEESFDLIKEKKDEDKEGVLSSLVSLDSSINVIKDISKEDYLELLIFLSKNKKVKSSKFKESIKVIDESTKIDDEYVFMMGFSQGIYPSISKDNDFLSNEEKEICGRNTSNVENEIKKESLKKFILSTKNIIITYKKKIGKEVYYLSSLAKEMDMEEKNVEIPSIRYSLKQAKLEVGALKDEYDDFGISSKEINTFTKEELRFKEYDHSFKPSSLLKNEDGFILMSYTSINDYNTCPFSYFVKRVLKANIYEDSFLSSFGNYYHLLLENSLNKEVILEDYKDEFDKSFITPKDRFFAGELIKQFYNVLEKNNSFKEHTQFKKWLGEQVFNYKIDDITTLNGKIDKMMIDEEHKEIAIVDYKTGSVTFDKMKINFGFGMQLPLYAILAKDKYKDYKVAGLYIQTILVNDPLDVKKKPYYLNGLTLQNNDVCSRLDENYAKSSYINGLSIDSTGGVKSSKNVILECELNDLVEETKSQISKACQSIRNGIFTISPLIDGTKSPCEFCKCQDICFVKNSDKRYYSKLKKEYEEKMKEGK